MVYDIFIKYIEFIILDNELKHINDKGNNAINWELFNCFDICWDEDNIKTNPKLFINPIQRNIIKNM